MPPHMRLSTRVLSCLTMVPVALAIGGCGNTLDVDKAEKTIGEDFPTKVQGNPDVRGVACPDDISADVGTKATCTMTLADDVRMEVALEVTGDNGRVRWEVVGGTLPGRVIEQQTIASLEKQFGKRPDGVKCPARVQLKRGSTTRCTLTDGEKAYGVTITMKNDQGGFDIEVDKQPMT